MIRVKEEGFNLPSRRGMDTTTIALGATASTEDVLSGVKVRGKRIQVTGVSAALGVETARSPAAHGAQVVGAGPYQG